MCHLRGVLMLKLNRGDQAKQCFMEALALDVKCYDAFDQLVTGEMMTPDEGKLHRFLCAPSFQEISRMGLHPGIGILSADTSRRSVCAVNLHRSFTKIQARCRTCLNKNPIS